LTEGTGGTVIPMQTGFVRRISPDWQSVQNLLNPSVTICIIQSHVWFCGWMNALTANIQLAFWTEFSDHSRYFYQKWLTNEKRHKKNDYANLTI